jgi:RNA polymerase sigma-70 factor (ECF subfamily)
LLTFNVLNEGSPYTDDELLGQLRAGNRMAFEAIYRRYWPVLYTTAYKRLGDKEQTEDVLQEVFARCWIKRETLRIQHLPAYLSSAVRYEVIRYLTRTKTAFSFFEPFEALLLEGETPEERLIAKELQELVYRYADTLPVKKRQIFLLHVRNKLSTREIAGELQISQKTVQNQLGSALQGLKANLAPVVLVILSTRL